MGLRLARSLSWLRSVNWFRLSVGLVLLAGVVGAYIEFDAARLQQGLLWVQENKTKGWYLFLLAYTLGVVLMLPAMVLGMLAGAVFGFVPGTVLGWVGSSVGQAVAFVIGRYLLREAVASYLTRQFPQWTAIDRALETEAWKLVTLLRLSPLAPWNVLNYALAVTAVPLSKYVFASSLAIVPYLALFTYAGSLARSLADVFAGKTNLDGRATVIVAVVSGLVMLLVVWYTTHVSRRAIAQALMSHANSLPPELMTDADVIALLRVADVVDEEGPDGEAADGDERNTELAATGTAPMSPNARRKDSGPEGTSLLSKDVEMGAWPGGTTDHEANGSLSPTRAWAHSAARQRAPLISGDVAVTPQD